MREILSGLCSHFCATLHACDSNNAYPILKLHSPLFHIGIEEPCADETALVL